ncbi:MAG: NblA/ycf18 family protein [Rivularia sp. (in: cyanobacteria)]
MNEPIELSLEQEWRLKSFASQVQHMSREQAQKLLIALHQQMMIQETTYRNLLMHEWNLDSGTAF